MTAQEIYPLLMDNSNFMYCMYKIIRVDREPEILISTDGGSRYETTKENIWNFVNKFDINNWNEDPKSVEVKEINGDDIISISIVRDNRL